VAPKKTAGRGAHGPLSPLIHGRARLLVLSYLLRAPKAHSFTSLRDALGFSDGSLSVNLAKLEAAGFVQLQKDFVDRKPQTLVRITERGQREFETYVEQLRGIIPGLD
jgi:DNA-binding MarR family transcriptional regulator